MEEAVDPEAGEDSGGPGVREAQHGPLDGGCSPGATPAPMGALTVKSLMVLILCLFFWRVAADSRRLVR